MAWTLIARASWKPRTAASVFGPNTPSTWTPCAGSPERLRNWNSTWTPRTASPVLPRRTVTTTLGHVCGPTIPVDGDVRRGLDGANGGFRHGAEDPVDRDRV